jgi:hypothetical protein
MFQYTCAWCSKCVSLSQKMLSTGTIYHLLIKIIQTSHNIDNTISRIIIPVCKTVLITTKFQCHYYRISMIICIHCKHTTVSLSFEGNFTSKPCCHLTSNQKTLIFTTGMNTRMRCQSISPSTIMNIYHMICSRKKFF